MNKKKLIIIISIVFILLLVGSISFYLALNKENNNIKYLKIKLNGKSEVTINYKEEYEDKGAKAFYKSKDITKNIKTKTDIDFDKIGSYSYTYTIKYKKYIKSIKRIVNIKDSEAPIIKLKGKEEITIYKDSKYNDEGVEVSDNYDEDLTDKVELNGEVDTKNIGEYIITYKVVDSSNNESKIERKVKVIEKPVIKETTTSTDGVKKKTSKGYEIEVKNGITYIDGILIANKSYSLPSSYNPGDLLDVFLSNFKTMQNDASDDGISLNVISGYRSYSRQNSIYNNYVSRDGKANADRYSARPGHSEHQTGLAADINSLGQDFADTAEGKWLNDNCYKYGFIIRYPRNKENITGYMFEPWHIRYVGKDLATKLYNNGTWITLEEYFGIDSKY